MSSASPKSSEHEGTASASAQHVATRRVVMVTSPGREDTLADVATNLATISGEIGQRVVLVSTAGLSSPEDDAESPESTALWWKHWPSPGKAGSSSIELERSDLMSGPLHPDDVEALLGDTGIPGVSRLDLRYFVGHPSQVVSRVPEVLDALRQVVDVVILEVPSFLTVHHGEALTPLPDAVLVVGERQSTTMDEMRRTSAALQRLGAPVVGMALTDAGVLDTDIWGVDSGLEESDEEPDEERDPTAQVPITGPDGGDDEAAVDDRLLAEHTAPEA